MATPTDLVNQFGKKVELYKAKDNETVSYENPIEILTVVSNPSDSDNVEEMGRVDMGERQITVSENIDISNNRNGLPDVVEINNEYYQVEEVRNDPHPMADIRKNTVTLAELDAVKESVLEPEG